MNELRLLNHVWMFSSTLFCVHHSFGTSLLRALQSASGEALLRLLYVKIKTVKPLLLPPGLLSRNSPPATTRPTIAVCNGCESNNVLDSIQTTHAGLDWQHHKSASLSAFTFPCSTCDCSGVSLPTKNINVPFFSGIAELTIDSTSNAGSSLSIKQLLIHVLTHHTYTER